MHLGNGAITPECAAVTFAAAAVGLTAAAAKLRRNVPSRDKLELAVGLGTLILAAQAINVPVAAGVSGHLVGGVLLAWTLGPALGAWTMALVLIVQAVALGDGGTLTLGANVLNMAILPAVLVTLAKQVAAFRASHLVAGSLAAGAVLFAAMLIAGETALFRSTEELAGWTRFAALMVGAHAWIGLLEGSMTTAILVSCASVASPKWTSPVWRRATIGIGACLLLAALVLPISSAMPDGYEAAAEASGMSWLLGR